MSCPPREADGLVAGVEAVTWSVRQIAPLVLEWSDCPAPLAAELDTWISRPPAITSAPVDGLQPARGWITVHPLYAAYWAQPRTGEFFCVDPTIARLAQGAVLVAAHLLAELPGGLAVRSSALQRACLGVRRILAGVSTPDAFWSIRRPEDLGEFREGVREVLHRPLTDNQHEVIRSLFSLVEDALAQRPPRLRARVQRVGSGSSHGWEPDDPTFPYEIYDQVTYQSVQNVADGSAPIVESATNQLIVVQTDSADAGLTDGQRYYRAKYRATAIETAAQGMLHSARRLQLVDLAALDLAAQRWLAKPVAPKLVVAATFLSLLCGRSIKQLQELILCRRWADTDNLHGSLGFYLDGLCLILPIEPLSKAYQPTPVDRHNYRPTTHGFHVTLPELPYTQVVYEALTAYSVKRPFLVSGLEAEVAAYLSALNREANARTTPTRIEQFLHSQVQLMTGDWADAALISGQRRSVDPRLYYYAPTTDYLVHIYDRVWSGVARALATETHPIRPLHVGSTPVYVGSQGCPTDAAVFDMVTTQMRVCREAREGGPSPDRARTAHNALTTYTLLLIAWHTGVRAVNEMIDLTQYDPVTGYLGVSDKDCDTYADARVVWLPEIAKQQVMAYRACVARLPNHLRPADDADDALFYLDAAGARERLTLRAIQRHLGDGYPFRPNSQRHYLRTKLRETGVPAQAVDALLGHGMRGQEPYARYSAYCPLQLRAEVAPALEQLSASMGWRVIPVRS